MLKELIHSLPHKGLIFRDENKTFFVIILKDVSGMSVDSTIKSYSRRIYGWAALLALIANHVGDTKYRAIVKSISNLLHNIKWDGRNYPLEQYVLNRRTAIDDIRDCATCIGNAVPNTPQRVEFLLGSITSQDNALQAAM